MTENRQFAALNQSQKIFTKKRSDIQILRAVAVIAVILFHTFPNEFQHGYLGVDIFFVVSGFLIFPQIFKAKKIESRQIRNKYIKQFLARRLLRILPALSVCISIVWVGYFFFGPSPRKFTETDSLLTISALIGLSNIAALKVQGDYFNSDSSFVHLWSLGVEIQAYLITAIYGLVLIKKHSNSLKLQKYKFLLHLLFFMLISWIFKLIILNYSYKLSAFGLETFSISPLQSDFYLIMNRFWEFALGGMLSQISRNAFTGLLNKYSFLLFTILLLLFFVPLGNLGFVRPYLVLLLLSLIILSRFEVKNGAISKTLSWIGDRSYSLYLYHLPILQIFIGDLIPLNYKLLFFIIGFCILFIISHFSFTLIERRFSQSSIENSKVSNPPHNLFFIFLAPIILIPIIVMYNNNSQSNQPYSEFIKNNYAASAKSACPLGQIEFPCTLVRNPSLKTWLLVGDSHAGALQNIVAEEARIQNVKLLVWNKCRFFDPNLSVKLAKLFPEWCTQSNDLRLKFIKEQRPDYLLIAYQNSKVIYGDKKMSQVLWQKIFSETLTNLSKSGVKIILFSQIPEYVNSPLDSYRISFRPEKSAPIGSFRNLVQEKDFAVKLATINKIEYIDVLPAFCSTKSCIRFDKSWLYFDSNHLTRLGADRLKPLLEKVISNG